MMKTSVTSGKTLLTAKEGTNIFKMIFLRNGCCFIELQNETETYYTEFLDYIIINGIFYYDGDLSLNHGVFPMFDHHGFSR